jgi:Domain of unknown function DUF29
VKENLYEQDFALWIVQQADALRRRDSAALDWDNLLDEIETLGQQEKRELCNHLTLLCQTLLKWSYQREFRCAHWRSTLLGHRQDIDQIFKFSPSLRDYAGAILPKAFADACQYTEFETGLLSCFQVAVCPWTIEQVLDHDFLPDGAAD